MTQPLFPRTWVQLLYIRIAQLVSIPQNISRYRNAPSSPVYKTQAIDKLLTLPISQNMSTYTNQLSSDGQRWRGLQSRWVASFGARCMENSLDKRRPADFSHGVELLPQLTNPQRSSHKGLSSLEPQVSRSTRSNYSSRHISRSQTKHKPRSLPTITPSMEGHG